MRRTRPFASLLLPALVLVLHGAAHAQELHWGLHFEAVAPQGDLSTLMNRSLGYGGDVNGIWQISGAHALRARLGGMDFRRTKDGGELKARATTGAVDYLYYLDGESSEGLYLMGGAEWIRWRLSGSLAFPPSGPTAPIDAAKNSLGGTVGLGYQLNAKLGLEARAFQSQLPADQGSARGLTLGFTVRF